MADSFEVDSEDQLTITVRSDGSESSAEITDTEIIRVNITAIGEKGDPGDGSGGSGVDLVARQKADVAQSTAVQAQIALQTHQTASQPHKAYDQDIPDLTLIFKNGLI